NAAASPPASCPAEMSACPVSCRCRPAPPMIANHTQLPREGTITAPATNSRIVRPRETRARKVTTCSALEAHQAQDKVVHLDNQSTAPPPEKPAVWKVIVMKLNR